MKLSIYLFLISLFQIHANSYSQNTKISLELDEVTIENVLREIESQSEFKFLYNDREVDYKKRVSVKFKKTKISKILNQLFSETNIDFEVLDKQIILVSKKEEAISSSPQQTINGIVADESGVGIPGANVLIKGTTKGAVTDFDGNFSIQATTGDVLEISFLGYVTQSVTVGSQTSINVTLKEDTAQLDEVVVIGYGSSKRSDLTEAVTQVSAKSFEKQPVTRVEEALQGRTAGVSVARSNGTPGAGAKIRVRGVNSITGNNTPLVVIDGFIGGDLRTLNPNDIESFNVLKDASATAIYGSRGANGVILVTTKKGRGKAKLEINSFVAVSELARSYDNRISALEHYRRLGNPGLFPPSITEQTLIDNPVPDKEDELFRTAFTENHQVSVSGGSDSFNYFVSGNYNKAEGTMITNNYERFSIRANLESQINDKLKVRLNTFYNREIDNNNPNAFNRTFGGPVAAVLSYEPTFRLYNPDGSFNFEGGGSSTYAVTNLLRSNIERKANRLNTNLNIEYKIIPSLTYTLVAGVTVVNGINNQIRIESPGGDAADLQFNNGSIITNEFTNYQISNIFNWSKTYGKHGIEATGVYEFTRNESDNSGFRRRQLPFEITNFALLASNVEDPLSITPISNSGRSAIESFLGRVKYTFDESLSLSASVRRDQTTAFLPEESVGVFKSFSAGYNFSKLAFIEDSNTLSNLRLRLSWGETGNQNAPRSAFENAFTSRFVDPGTGTPIEIRKQTTIANPNLTWETTEQANIGIDIGFFNGRINLTLDAYQKTTRDLIVRTLNNPNVPGTFITENVGDVENKGIDVSLNANIIQSENFTWNSTLAFSYLQNEVVAISPRLDQDFIEGTFQDVGLREPINVIKVGEPLGSFWGTEFLGVDENGNAIKSQKKVLGSGLPTTTWGLNNTFNYKNWDFNLFLQGSHGFEVFNQVEAALAGGNPSFFNNLKTDKEFVNQIGLNSSRYVESGDFIRLSNLSLGYTFDNPTKGISSINIYGSGQNLFLITDYGGYDPETSSNQSIGTANNADVGAGVDLGAIPNPRTYTFGVKVVF